VVNCARAMIGVFSANELTPSSIDWDGGWGLSLYQYNGRVISDSTYYIADAIAEGSVIGVALDLDSSKISFYVDSNYVGGMFLHEGLSSNIPLYPSFGIYQSGSYSEVTANFGDTEFLIYSQNRSEWDHLRRQGYLPLDYYGVAWDNSSKYLISSGLTLWTYRMSTSNWEDLNKSPSTISPSDFSTDGITYLSMIPSAKWEQFTEGFVILTMTNLGMASFKIDAVDYNPLDMLRNSTSVSVLSSSDDTDDKVILNVPEYLPIYSLNSDNILLSVWSDTIRSVRLSCSLDNFIPSSDLPSPYLYKYDALGDQSVYVKLPAHELYYAVSRNGSEFYYFNGSDFALVEDVYEDYMTYEQLLSIPSAKLSNLVGNTPYLGIFIKSNIADDPVIDQAGLVTVDSFYGGADIVTTNQESQVATLDWANITECQIFESIPEGCNIRYAFSNNGGASWQIFNGYTWVPIDLTNLSNLGNTSTTVKSINSDEWRDLLRNTLDVAACLLSENTLTSPTLDKILFHYDQVPNPFMSAYINIPVPVIGFRNVLDELGKYEFKVAQGLAFDDSTVDYDFYTTPDKIKLRMLEMGTVIGGKESLIYQVEIINGYDASDFDVTLRASLDGVSAKEMGSYGLLPDAEKDRLRTVVELSLEGESNFTPVYPLVFRLNAQSRKLFHVRIKPTITTSGDKVFQITLNGRPV